MNERLDYEPARPSGHSPTPSAPSVAVAHALHYDPSELKEGTDPACRRGLSPPAKLSCLCRQAGCTWDVQLGQRVALIGINDAQ
jgi:hypothetical protein